MAGFCLEVAGELACFTRPEMKVERVSYDVITPSAARAIFEAILWKPAIRWRITRIQVLSPIRWISARRNEVGVTMSPRSSGILIEDSRQQRAGLLLRDVRYRLWGRFDYIPPDARPDVFNPTPDWLTDDAERNPDAGGSRKDESEAKYAAMFERRAQKGQSFNQPYLGCREFSAEYCLIGDGETEPAANIPEELRGERDLGWMLYDLDFSDPASPTPMFYKPRMNDGVIDVPAPDSEEVRR